MSLFQGDQAGGGVTGPVATEEGTMTQVRVPPVIQYLRKHLNLFFMQVDSEWVDLILSEEKKIKYAPWFVAAIGKILLLRENQSIAKKGKAQKGTPSPGGFCRAALVVGHPFQKDKDPTKFLDSWGCRNYKNGFPIQFILIFPPFVMNPITYKQGSTPGQVSKSDLAKCLSALNSPRLRVISYLDV